MNTPSTPQSRSAAAAATETTKPITPSQIPLPSTPTATSTPKPATGVPLRETPIPITASSIEKPKLVAKIPLPETPTPAAATSEHKVDDGFWILHETTEVSSAVPTDLTPYLPSRPPSKPTPSILQHSTPTPEISPLKLAPAPTPAPTSQSQSHLSDSLTSSITRAESINLGDIPLLGKDKEKDN